MPRSSSICETRIAREELPRMIGITGVSALVPVSRLQSLASLRKSSDRSRSRVTRQGSRWITRSPSSAAAAFGGEQAVEKTKAGVV
jgi:hypothetical protein